VYGPPPEVEKARRALEKVLEGLATITMAGESFLDILPQGVSKGSALDWYLGSLKHRPRVVVAVGDHLNDCELLDRADIAVSMEDAPPMLKQKADIILPPASEGGFRKLPEYLLDQSFVQDLMFSRHAPEKGRGLVPVEKNKEGLC
jgi:hydroxymethylpyrimidine pyrophosphatase-like HAD family hydrolase